MIYSLLFFSIADGFYSSSSPLLSGLVLALGLSAPFVYEFVRYLNQRKTQYAVTEKYLLFKFFNGIKYSIKAIKIKDITSITLVEIEKEKDIGTLILVTQLHVGFNPHRFSWLPSLTPRLSRLKYGTGCPTQSSRNRALGRLGKGKGSAGLGCESFAKRLGVTKIKNSIVKLFFLI